MIRPTKRLGELIAEQMSVPGNVPDPNPQGEFIISGLRTAVSANKIKRRNILSEISDILGCRPQDLEFLYTNIDSSIVPTQKYELMVPDFQTKLFALAE